MPLRAEQIEVCFDDNALFKLLAAELTERLGPEEGDDLDLFLNRISQIPVGLRAMAAVYQLDVSLTLDNLGWHFANWHHRGYCDMTLWALGELGAHDHAGLFGEAYRRVLPFWDEIGIRCSRDFEDFVAWYGNSELERLMLPLTKKMWDLQEIDGGLFGFWTRYARKHPERVGG
ncbi:hypothetical protein RPMA_15665 [Tardiphaga alba]|uniref:DUF4375 domain-containing protein n=1 Tax=Tardiphaga alba TaxID=340268 RepID=A0ABX8A8V2_9BRAD|nr:hypothetical protein [Tardiphaga alba]QUS40107.1 hypothetical protein RPMA_15665 [Tardiphaga alba]